MVGILVDTVIAVHIRIFFDTFIFPQNDPIFYGQLNLSPSEKAKFHSGEKVVNELNNLVFNNKPIYDVLFNSKEFMEHFHTIFPEVEKSNDTGKLNRHLYR